MKVAVVGYPNVGKSSLVNRLTQSREAVVHERPGVTRDRKEIADRLERAPLPARSTRAASTSRTRIRSPSRSRTRCAPRSRTPTSRCSSSTPRPACGPATRRSPRSCAAADLPVVVAANKIDGAARPARSCTTSTASGFGEPLAVSAAQGLGTGDLLDRVVELLPPEPEEDEVPDDVIRLAVIGRPNVGKSSLVNAFLGRERVIVSEVAGTTRDSIDTLLEVDGREVLLVDTAGIRRASKVRESVEYYTVLRSQRAAERADVALVVCDAQDGITSQDLRIAELAMKSGCATALVLNKWDLTGGDVEARGPGGGVGAAGARRRARAREPQDAAAPAGPDRLARRPGATSSACCRRRCRSPTAPRTASRPRSSTACSARSPPRASRRPSRATG